MPDTQSRSVLETWDGERVRLNLQHAGSADSGVEIDDGCAVDPGYC